MSKKIICPRCKGSGKESWLEGGIFCAYGKLLAGRNDCPVCDGQGYLEDE